MSNVADIVKGEFDAYYLVSEMPRDWGESFLFADVPMMAKDSADRLRRRAGVNSLLLPDVVAFLESVRNNPNHEFMMFIANPDAPDWTTEDNWPIFRELLRLMIDHLSR